MSISVHEEQINSFKFQTTVNRVDIEQLQLTSTKQNLLHLNNILTITEMLLSGSLPESTLQKAAVSLCLFFSTFPLPAQ